jgi:hypothetical protein
VNNIETSTARIVRRFLVLASRTDSGDHSPDPYTYRAFLSEFEKGEETGLEQGESMMHQGKARDVDVDIDSCGTIVSQTVWDLMEMAKRMNAITSRGQVMGVNERRLSAKMSGILSTLFYFTGRQKGLTKALKETAYSPTLPSAPEAPRARV